jgi:hypothetical protein
MAEKKFFHEAEFERRPWARYAHPGEITGSVSLTNDQKSTMLANWLADVEQRLDTAGIMTQAVTETELNLLERLRRDLVLVVKASERAAT